MNITTKEYSTLLQSIYRGKFLLTYITKDILNNPDTVISDIDLKYLTKRMTTLNETIRDYEEITKLK
jgi:hypothetical protein|tara:strand:- start:291 stop:491 length:201 start_codon:yes stop_codon:yes gene_type:complete